MKFRSKRLISNANMCIPLAPFVANAALRLVLICVFENNNHNNHYVLLLLLFRVSFFGLVLSNLAINAIYKINTYLSIFIYTVSFVEEKLNSYYVAQHFPTKPMSIVGTLVIVVVFVISFSVSPTTRRHFSSRSLSFTCQLVLFINYSNYR